MSEHMETTMKSYDLAKRLRARLAALKAERKKHLASYDSLFEQWKIDVAKWLRTEPQKVIPRVTKRDIEHRHYSDNRLPSFVFKGIPKPPERPKDDTIRDIQKTLRYLAFTGVPKVAVSKSQLDDWFGKIVSDEEQDDDD